MVITFENLIIGEKYERPYLAELWGYQGYQAIAKGIVTPANTSYIILFVTEEKQAFQTQYRDKLEDNSLYMEGETKHVNDYRLVNAERDGEEIYLFHRNIHHTPFTYYGRVHLIEYKLRSDQPSSFVFSVAAKSPWLLEFDRAFLSRQASYKMVTILALLNAMDDCGTAEVDDVVRRFASFYRNRCKQDFVVEKSHLTMNRISDLRFNEIKGTLLKNPVHYLGNFIEYDKGLEKVYFKEKFCKIVNDKDATNALIDLAIRRLDEYYRDLDSSGYTEDDWPTLFSDDEPPTGSQKVISIAVKDDSSFNSYAADPTLQKPKTIQSVGIDSEGQKEKALDTDLLPAFFEKVIEPLALTKDIEIGDVEATLHEWRKQDQHIGECIQLIKRQKQELDLMQEREEELKRLLRIRRELDDLKSRLNEIEIASKKKLLLKQKKDLELIEAAIEKIYLCIDLCRKEVIHYGKWAEKVKEFTADGFTFHELDSHVEDAAETAVKLKNDYCNAASDANKEIQRIDDKSDVFVKSNKDISQMWDALSKELQQANSLKEQLSPVQVELQGERLQKKGSKSLLWVGIALIIVGAGLVILNPMELLYWLLTFIGAVISLVGLRAAHQVKKQFNETLNGKIGNELDSDNKNEFVNCCRVLDKLVDELLGYAELSKQRIQSAVFIKKELEEKQEYLLLQLEHESTALTNAKDSTAQDGIIDSGAKQSVVYRIAALEKELEKKKKSAHASDLLKENIEELEARQVELAEGIEKTAQEIKLNEHEITAKPLTSVPEKIRTFLLHGGNTARVWLVETVRLYKDKSAGINYTVSPRAPLPESVINAFNIWWNNENSSLEAESGQQRTIRRRLSAPDIKLDSIGEIKLSLPAQRFDGGDESAQGWVKLYDSESKEELHIEMLTVYQRSQDIFETEDMEIPLLSLASNILVELGLGQKSINIWKIQLMFNADTPVLVFNLEGKLCLEDPLPRERLWLIMQEDFAIDNNLEPLEEAPLYLKGNYYMQLMDLSMAAESKIVIADQLNGCEHFIELSGDVSFVPQFRGEVFTALKVDEVHPLYLKEKLELYIPTAALSELSSWGFEICFKDDSAKKIAYSNLEELDEILSYDHANSAVILPLSEIPFILNEKCGRYRIRLFNPLGDEKTLELNFIEQLEYEFSKKLYFQDDNEPENIKLRICCSEELVLNAIEPELLKRMEDNLYLIELDYKLDHFRFIINGQSDIAENVQIPVTLAIPKLRWRINGSSDKSSYNWSNQVRELWIGDWYESEQLDLYISIPSFFEGRACLELLDSGHYYEVEIEKGAARFNLLPFIDTLQAACGVADFKLTIKGRTLSDEAITKTLFRVRTEWVVEKFELNLSNYENENSFEANWLDRGMVDNRVLQFWDKSQPSKKPVFEVEIPDGASSFTFKATWQDLPAGSYLASIIVQDPWNAVEETFIIPTDFTNTFPVNVLDEHQFFEEVVLKWHGKNLFIRGRLENSAQNCEIEILLIGFSEGRWISWSYTELTDQSACFNVALDADREATRWVGLYSKHDPSVYYYEIVPSPPRMQLNLKENLDVALQFSKSNLVKVGLYWKHRDNDKLLLMVLDGSNFIRFIAAGKESFDFKLRMTDGSIKDAKMEFITSSNRMTIKLEEGIVCTSCDCGKIFSDAQAWYKHSSWQESPSCKSFIYNFNQIDAEVIVDWDIAPYIEEAKEISPLYYNMPLFSNTGQSTDEELNSIISDPSPMAKSLLQQEVKWVSHLTEMKDYTEEG